MWGWGSWYLFDSAELVHCALVVLHAVLGQVQVGRVLGGHKWCSCPCSAGSSPRSPCHHRSLSPDPWPGTLWGELPSAAPPVGSATTALQEPFPPPRTLLSSFWYCGIFFSIWDRSLMVVCEGTGHGHSPLGT